MVNFAYLLSHEKFDSVNDIVFDDEDVVEDKVARKVFNKLKSVSFLVVLDDALVLEKQKLY